jgi:23S rRNA (adenine2030-N6)-methyltransferase
MNYRHAFHAGNHADVLKHVALLELLRLLTAKDKPLAYVDTHAGAGGYAIAEEAEKTGEWREGIGRLWEGGKAPPAIERYLAAVRSWNVGSEALRRYPGSPGLAADALRTQDRLVLCESQPDVAAELTRRLADHDARVRVITGDGYATLKALLPPPERRALVLLDPPYEAQLDEFDLIIAALRDALRRFATGAYAVWYPIKRPALLAPFLRRLASLETAKSVLTMELWVRKPDSPLRLNGSGVAVVNPPWQFDTDARTWLPWLSQRLALQQGAGWRCEWLKRETR